MNKIISDEILQAIMRYLVSRPYNEVYQAIPLLQSLPDAPVSAAVTVEEPSA